MRADERGDGGANACSDDNSGPSIALMTLSGGAKGHQTSASLASGEAWLASLAGSGPALDALAAIDEATMSALGYPVAPLKAFAKAAKTATAPLYDWFLESWLETVKTDPSELVDRASGGRAYHAALGGDDSCTTRQILNGRSVSPPREFRRVRAGVRSSARAG